MTADYENHARQRKAWAPAFSEKALREQEYIIQSYVDKLMDRLELMRRTSVVDVTAWFVYFSKSSLPPRQAFFG